VKEAAGGEIALLLTGDTVITVPRGAASVPALSISSELNGVTKVNGQGQVTVSSEMKVEGSTEVSGLLLTEPSVLTVRSDGKGGAPVWHAVNGLVPLGFELLYSADLVLEQIYPLVKDLATEGQCGDWLGVSSVRGDDVPNHGWTCAVAASGARKQQAPAWNLQLQLHGVDSSAEKNNGLSGGAVAGIVIGVIVGLAVIALVVMVVLGVGPFGGGGGDGGGEDEDGEEREAPV
jgi:hypothetical protein